MSYDIQLWSIAKPDWESILADDDSWQYSESSIKKLNRKIGQVPKKMAQGRYGDPPPRGSKTTYPKVWPFDYPFKEN